MRKNVLLISFVLSLPFWLGINTLAKNLEDFWYSQEIIKRPEILTASADQAILGLKVKETRKQKLKEEYFNNLEIESESAISVEVDNRGNEKVLFEKNPQKSLPIASLTKLMTALVIFDLDETYNFLQLIKITKEAVGQEGSSKYGDLRVGESLLAKDLLYKMLIESSNDAAFALTEPIGKEAFVGLMNLYAKELGLENTHFVNPTGLESNTLEEPNNISTTRDLVKLARYIIENYPQIFEITTHQSYEFLKPDGSLHHFIAQNTNELLGEIPGIIGGKTGWEIEAEGCLLLIIKHPKGNYFINVILGSNDRFAEMRKIIDILNI